VSQSFPLAGKRGLRAAAAAAEAEAAVAMVEAAAREVVAEATAAFAEWWYLHQARAVAVAQLQLVQQLEGEARGRYRTAEAPFADVVRAQLEVGRAEDEVRTLEEVLPAAAARLNAALGREVEVPLPPPTELPEPAFPSESQAGATNPELEALARQQEAAVRRLDLARLIRVPDLTLGFEVMHSNEMRRSGVGVMAGINLPIWRNCCRNEVREAAAEAEAAGATLAAKVLEVAAAQRLARFRLADARRKEELVASRLLPQAEQALAAMTAAYRAGEASFADLVEMARLGQELRLALARARADTAMAWAELERLAGTATGDGRVGHE
ncbi:MAG: TolC family protein, partial [Acidobacteriota bacterium]|jgi:outer membrane protein TolC